MLNSARNATFEYQINENLLRESRPSSSDLVSVKLLRTFLMMFGSQRRIIGKVRIS